MKLGTEYGLCNYSKHQNQKKPIDIYDLNDNYIKTYESAQELVRVSKDDYGVVFNATCISAVCKNKQNSHKGFKFKYHYNMG